jgi:hypothetical protein
MCDKSGYSSVTFIFLPFVFSFHILVSQVEVMQSVFRFIHSFIYFRRSVQDYKSLLCYCDVLLVGNCTLQTTMYKMLISLLQMPLEE